MKVMTSKQFIDKLKWLVYKVPNKYYSGKLWLTYDKNDGKWRMDCVLSVKGILWGFNANKNKYRGGADYGSNGVKDFSCNGALTYCNDVSQNFEHLVAGEYLCMKGTKFNHTGIYLGDGKVFECTTSWGTNKCIISQIDKKGTRTYNGKWSKANKWTYHGKLKWIDYTDEPQPINQVKILQAYMNEQWNCGLAVDGHFGPLTREQCRKHQLTFNCKAPIMVKWLQARLYDYGYNIAVDGSFGYDTKKKVIEFQKSRHLNPDAIVGENTYKALTE